MRYIRLFGTLLNKHRSRIPVFPAEPTNLPITQDGPCGLKVRSAPMNVCSNNSQVLLSENSFQIVVFPEIRPEISMPEH